MNRATSAPKAGKPVVSHQRSKTALTGASSGGSPAVSDSPATSASVTSPQHKKTPSVSSSTTTPSSLSRNASTTSLNSRTSSSRNLFGSSPGPVKALHGHSSSVSLGSPEPKRPSSVVVPPLNHEILAPEPVEENSDVFEVLILASEHTQPGLVEEVKKLVPELKKAQLHHITPAQAVPEKAVPVHKDGPAVDVVSPKLGPAGVLSPREQADLIDRKDIIDMLRSPRETPDIEDPKNADAASSTSGESGVKQSPSPARRNTVKGGTLTPSTSKSNLNSPQIGQFGSTPGRFVERRGSNVSLASTGSLSRQSSAARLVSPLPVRTPPTQQLKKQDSRASLSGEAKSPDGPSSLLDVLSPRSKGNQILADLLAYDVNDAALDGASSTADLEFGTMTRQFGARPAIDPQVVWQGENKEQIRIAFTVADRSNTAAVAAAASRADIIFGEPDAIVPFLYDSTRLKWVQSSYAGVEALVKAVKARHDSVERQKAEWEAARKKHEEEKAALLAKRRALIARFEEQSPLLREANERVNKMAKSDLDSLKKLVRPPESVRLCLESVVVLLGYPAETVTKNFDQVLRIVTEIGFKSRILWFDPFSVSKELQEYMEKTYFKNPEFTMGKMDYGFYACGSLFRWVAAQLKLSEATDTLRPLIMELGQLKQTISQMALDIRKMELRAKLCDEELKFQLSRMAGVFGNAIAEYCLGHIIGRERQLPHFAQTQADKKWRDPAYTYRTLSELSVGVLGVGDIGARVATVLKTLGVTTRGFIKHEAKRAEASKVVDHLFVAENHPSALSEFLSGCDYFINTLPMTKDTAGLLTLDALKACKAGAVFINVGRGSIVDETVLIQGLTEKKLHAAILDVFATEPLPATSPLWNRPDVVITPHVAALTKPADAARLFVENLKKFTAGKPLQYSVNVAEEY